MGIVLLVVCRASYVCSQVTQGTGDGGGNVIEVGRLTTLTHLSRSKVSMFA